MKHQQLVPTLLALSLIASSAWAQDAQSVIAEAAKTMGVTAGLDSVTYIGAGTSFALGQSVSVNGLSPARSNLSDYRRTLDFKNGAVTTRAVTYAAPPQGGDARLGVSNEIASAANANNWSLQMQLWLSPWGFLKGAATHQATLTTQTTNNRTVQVVSWDSDVKAPSGKPYKVVGYINDQHVVDRVETWLENPVFGDMIVQANYTQYRKNHEGLMYPGMETESRGGQTLYPIQIFGALANPPQLADYLKPAQIPGNAAPPAGAAPAGPPPAAPPVAKAEKMADGVYRITGGYEAVAVEFNDYILLFEAAGQNEARAQAVMAEAKRVIPNKPIRYAVLSHSHFDHTSGIAAVVAEGSTIVVHESDVAFFDKALNAPRTLKADAISTSGKKPAFEGVGDKRVFQDAKHTAELHRIQGLPHAEDLLVLWLPKEKIVVTADLFTLPPPNAPVANPPPISAVVMMANFDRLGLNFDTMVSVHAPNPDVPITRAAVLRALGRTR